MYYNFDTDPNNFLAEAGSTTVQSQIETAESTIRDLKAQLTKLRAQQKFMKKHFLSYESIITLKMLLDYEGDNLESNAGPTNADIRKVTRLHGRELNPAKVFLIRNGLIEKIPADGCEAEKQWRLTRFGRDVIGVQPHVFYRDISDMINPIAPEPEDDLVPVECHCWDDTTEIPEAPERN